jgi:hypothetical protein
MEHQMEGELSQESAPEVEAEGPIDPGVVEQPENLEADSSEDSQPEQQAEPDDDSEEFEWEGRRIKAPKGLKDGVLMHADYTRKTQGLSAEKKALEERAERIEQQAKASEEEISARARMHHIDAELKRFEAFDWSQYQQARLQDPLQADEAWNYVQHLRSQRNEAAQSISQAENARSAEAQQETARRLHETEQFARSKGWTAETDKQVIEFAVSKGATPKDLQAMMNPLVYETLYLARLGEQTLKKGMAAPKPGTPAAPLHVVAAKANPPARKDLASMSMEEYVATRQKQLAAKSR